MINLSLTSVYNSNLGNFNLEALRVIQHSTTVKLTDITQSAICLKASFHHPVPHLCAKIWALRQSLSPSNNTNA